MVEIDSSQPPKNQMKAIFPRQEEIKVKRGNKTGRKQLSLTQKAVTNVLRAIVAFNQKSGSFVSQF